MSGFLSRAQQRRAFLSGAERFGSPTIIAALVAVMFHSSVQAQTANFTSTTDANLGNAANWQNNALPNSSTTASLGQGVPSALVLQNTNLTAQSLVYTPTTTASSITLSTSGTGSTNLNLGGITNNSTTAQTIFLSSPNTTLTVSGSGATIAGPVDISVSGVFADAQFTAGAGAGVAQIQVISAGTTLFDASSAQNARIDLTGIHSSAYFQNASTAQSSTISVGAASGLGFLDSSSAGSSTINNSGSTTFAGSSKASSATIMNSNLVSVANAASLDHASLANSGDTEFTGTATAGQSSVTNTGTLAFHDQTTAGAATISNSGALTFADSSSSGTASITNSTAGAISFAGSADASTASITNSGSIDLSAMQGTLSIGSLNGSGTVALGSNDLTLGSLGHSDTFTGVISGTGGLNKTGAGTLTLSGANLYSGTTSVLAGSIDLSGTLASPIVVANQAVLTGAGSTASNVQVSTGGSFQPGNGFHVGGNLTLSPQSQFVVAVTPTGPASSAIVAGTASIGSSNLNIQAAGAATSYVPSTNYTILSAAQGVNGTFAQVAVNLPLLSPSVHYAADDVTVSFTQLPVSGGGAGTGINSMTGGSGTGTGGTSGGTSAGTSGGTSGGTTGSASGGTSGTSGNSISGGNGSGSSLLIGLDNLNSASLGNALSSLGASSYGAMRRIELEDADAFTRKVADHHFSQRTLDGDEGPGWIELEASRGSDSDDFGSTSWNKSGLIGGMDLQRSDTSVIGFSAQYLRGAADLGNGSNGTTSRVDFGLDGTMTIHDDLILSGMLSYGQHHDDVRRYIAFGSYQEGPNANSGGNDFTGRGEVATRLSWRGVSFMPYAALQWTMANADSFEEGGGAATDLFGGARRENLVTSSLGVRARSIGLWPSTLVGGISMTSLSGGLAWIHQSGCLDGQVVASFLEDTAHTPFLSTAGSIGADRAEANLAVNTTWSSGWHLQLRLSGDAGHAIHSAEAFAGVGVDFY